MQIIIPMSGFGERFREAGYTIPKPLIEVEGKPVIAHVVDMFPGETDVSFICNQEHLENPTYKMREILLRYCPAAKIYGIAPHHLGPVHAVLQIADEIDLKKPTVVNYCDFTCDWDWNDFKVFTVRTKCDGAIPAYNGFHPHTLGTTNYAYMKEEGGWAQDIQEKQPYTDNRMEEYASSGTYYFASGELALWAFLETVKRDLSLKGEYYVSLAYKPMFDAGKKVAVYPLKHFMQWGTPEDLQEYIGWSNAFRMLAEGNAALPQKQARGTIIAPMAGMGMRFAREGYKQTKPLIPVSGKPMAIQALGDFPRAKAYSFVLRADMPERDVIQKELKCEYPGAIIKVVPEVTNGQAITANIGLEALEAAQGHAAEGPISFVACDNGAVYDETKFDELANNPETDVIVWAFRGNANAARRPQMFGWIAHDGDDITRVSVKVPLEDPAHDPIVIGTFTFKNPDIFRRCLSRMIERDARVNNEFYLDTMVNDALELGMKCKIFEIDAYLSWGTPNDLRVFEYWQDCFDGWAAHPYSKTKDAHFPSSNAVQLSSAS